jgi:hypothetical protein
VFHIYFTYIDDARSNTNQVNVRGVPDRQIAQIQKAQPLIVAHKMTDCKEFYSWRLTEAKSNPRQDTVTQKLTSLYCVNNSVQLVQWITYQGRSGRV